MMVMMMTKVTMMTMVTMGVATDIFTSTRDLM